MPKEPKERTFATRTAQLGKKGAVFQHDLLLLSEIKLMLIDPAATHWIGSDARDPIDQAKLQFADTKKGVPKDPSLRLIVIDQPRAVIVAVETVTNVRLVRPAPAASLVPETLFKNRVPVATPDSALSKVIVPDVPDVASRLPPY